MANKKLKRIILIALFFVFFLLGAGSIYMGIVNQANMSSYISFALICWLIGSFCLNFCFKNIYISLGKTFVTIGAFFLFLGFFLIPFNYYSQEITQSLTPTIELFALTSFEDIMASQFDMTSSQSVDIVKYENTKEYKLNANDLKEDEVDFFVKEVLGFKNDYTFEQKGDITKLVLSQFYSQIEKSQVEVDFSNMIIPKDLIKSKINEITDIDSLESKVDLSFSLGLSIDGLYSEDNLENITITFLDYTGKKVNTFNLPNLKKESVNYIWSNLEFGNQVSYETKEYFSKVLLYFIVNNKDSFDAYTDEISFTLIKMFLPQIYKDMMSYDFMTTDYSARYDYFSKVKVNCPFYKDNLSKEFCLIFSQLNHENLMNEFKKTLNNQSEDIAKLPINLSSTVEKIDTPQKMQSYIQAKTSFVLFIFLGVFFYFISMIFFFLYYKFNEKFNRFSFFEIPYKLSVYNLSTSISFLIINILVWNLIGLGFLFDFFFSWTLNPELVNLINIFSLTQFYSVILNIFEVVAYISFAYVLFSIMLFFIFLILKRKLFLIIGKRQIDPYYDELNKNNKREY